jgi:hypothetical protein
MPENEIDRLDPLPGEPITLTTGLSVVTVPMRTRQVFRLMRILTHGAGAAMLAGAMDFNADPAQFVSRLLSMALLAIPDAESETIEFIASMCEPTDLKKPVGTQELSDEAKASNQKLWDRLNTDLFNPDPLDTIDLIERIIQTEGADLQALGKRLGRMMETFSRTGQKLTPTEESPLPSPQVLAENSSAPSPQSSTPSAPSTDGQTSTSSVSPSADSAPLAPPSVLVGQPEMSESAG